MSQAFLGRAGGGHGLGDLRDLVTSPNNFVALVVLRVLNFLVLLLCPLPNLDLATATNDTNTHSREKVMGRVGVHIDPTVEHSGGVFTDAGADHGLSSRVRRNESGNVMDNTSHSNEATAILRLVLEVVPFHNGEGIEWNTPVKFGTLLIKLFLHLLDTALIDFVLFELLQIIGKAELFPSPDCPLGWIILVPFNGVAVVGRELVVEIVIALTERDESGDDVVTRGVAVIKWLISEPMSKGIDTESSLLHEKYAQDSSVDEATEPVTP